MKRLVESGNSMSSIPSYYKFEEKKIYNMETKNEKMNQNDEKNFNFIKKKSENGDEIVSILLIEILDCPRCLKN